MDTNKSEDHLIVTPEEEKFDQEILSELPEADLRSKIAEEFGVDPEDEPELLEKLVKREQSHREKLSSAIKQKINWREKAITNPAKKTSKKEDGESPAKTQGLTVEEINRLLDEREFEREISQLELSEEIKKEIKDLATVKSITIREALKLPYVNSLIEEAKKEQRINSAIPKRSGKGGYAISYDPSKALDPADFPSLDTEEGQKAWNEAKRLRQKYLASQN